MNSVGRDVYQPLNVKLLAKREETEKLIVNECIRVKSLWKEKENIHKKLVSTEEVLHRQSNELINRNALLSGEMMQLKFSITEVQNLVQEIMCKIDGIKPKQWLASMVQEKEKRTLLLFYGKMEHQNQIFREFWGMKLHDCEILELNYKKVKLAETQKIMQEEINWVEEKCSESKITKLIEECTILKKRNAAMLKRKTRVLEQLEQKIIEKIEELAQEKRNMIPTT